MKPIFITQTNPKPICYFSTEPQTTEGAVNIRLVTLVTKGDSKEDNKKYAYYIFFKPFNIFWIYETQYDRDLDYERIISIEQ
jgi:hypothetical protein